MIPGDEPLVPVREALGQRLGHRHRATFRRWIIDGLRTPNGVVRLVGWQFGSRWLTTTRLAGEFCDLVVSGHQDECEVRPAA
jgi:hypothetical protein